MKIDEAKEREACSKWLSAEVLAQESEWGPTVEMIWLAARQQPVRVTREAFDKACRDMRWSNSHSDMRDAEDFLHTLNIEVIDA